MRRVIPILILLLFAVACASANQVAAPVDLGPSTTASPSPDDETPAPAPTSSRDDRPSGDPTEGRNEEPSREDPPEDPEDELGVIAGTVTGSNGAPLASMCVQARRPGGGPDDRVFAEATTGVDGRYVLRLGAGDYAIRFSDCADAVVWYGGVPSEPDAGAPEGATPVWVENGGEATGIDGVLPV